MRLHSHVQPGNDGITIRSEAGRDVGNRARCRFATARSAGQFGGIDGSAATARFKAAGVLYYASDTGLYTLQGGTSTLLIRVTNTANGLGANPNLFAVADFTVLGPKRLLILSAGQLLVATLP